MKGLLICISMTLKNRHQIPMFQQLLNSIFLYSNPNTFDVLFLLDQYTVTPVMRSEEIDAFAYTVALNGLEDNLKTLMMYNRVLILAPNVLLQGNVQHIVDMELDACIMYSDMSNSVKLCRPFRKMFKSNYKHRDIGNMVTHVRTLKDCFTDKMFLLFQGSSEHKKFVRKYFNKLMMNKCHQ